MTRATLCSLLLLAACAGADKAGGGSGGVDTDTPNAPDADGDGYFDEDDCDDRNPDTHPNASELCDGVDNDCDGTVDEEVEEPWYADTDGDGFGDPDSLVEACEAPQDHVSNGLDCDDADASVYPAAGEACDGVDNDCDGDTDEDGATAWYADADGDGWGDEAEEVVTCDSPEGHVSVPGDCDDANADVWPGRDEVCDGLDNDCDAIIDEGVELSWYPDADADGYGDDSAAVQACEAPEGHVAEGGDCDDSDAAYHPGALEADCADPADYNCDGSTGYDDLDADGWAACEECDDADADIRPDAVEVCNEEDDNCDGLEDDADPSLDLSSASPWYRDADRDSYGDAGSVTLACELPTGHSADDQDCDDSAAAVHPGASEVCNSLDDDCDAQVDDDDPSLNLATASDWYDDADGDSYGDPDASHRSCSAPSSTVADSSDCDDSAADIHPAASEVCDGLDNDCDAAVDDADSSLDSSTGLRWYEDDDSDSYGDAGDSQLACAQPAGHVGNDDDCDPADGDVHPGATEVCGGADEDCDGLTDDADPSRSLASTSTWYEDSDSDSYGDPASSERACEPSAGFVDNDDDCDDSAAAISPAASEVCDDIDNDCDSAVDDADPSRDASTGSAWYLDADSDSYGNPSRSQLSCEAPSGHVSSSTDCDDGRAAINPAATEVCDSVDNDCDSAIDDADSSLDSSTGATWYRDGDSDGYGLSTSTTRACLQPSGYSSVSTDCDDGAAAISPAASEICDDIDNDCDSAIDDADGSLALSSASTWYRDGDSDGYGLSTSTTRACDLPSGYVASATDCNDSAAAVNPGASEVCNSIDDDCDSSVDDADSSVDLSTGSSWYRDADGDLYGDATSSARACAQPSGHVSDARDCNDGLSAINPAATEICDDIDNDCDSAIDDADSSLASATATTWYRDADTDGYGSSSTTTRTCDAPSGYVASSTDCNDSATAISPAASEVCDDIDNDCDALTDDADLSLDESTGSTFWRDGDSDGYGDAASSTMACDQPASHVTNDDDCDDSNSINNPAGTETCDDMDNDCDALVDEAGATGEQSWYPDSDLDGYGSDSAAATLACDAPSGRVSSHTDCDDTDDGINPGETEYCDGTDNDCDGDEDGVVTFVSATGSLTDRSSTWAAGTVTTSTSITLSTPGTMWICPGTYAVSLTVSGGTDLYGPYGSESTILTGRGGKRVVLATSNMDLEGLTITDGYSSSSYGGGLYANGYDISLVDVVFSDNQAVYGGGLAVRNGDLTADSVEIANNTATSQGGGLYMSTNATLVADLMVLSGNDATYGGGIYATSADIEMVDSELSTNLADTSGGALYLASSSAADLTTSEVTGNTAGDYGGGVYQSASDLTLTRSNLSTNDAGLLGGGAYLAGASDLSCTGTSTPVYGIWGNTALLAGGAYVAASTGRIYSSVCDWTASSDNDLYDIVLGSTYLAYSKGNNATFTCTSTGC